MSIENDINEAIKAMKDRGSLCEEHNFKPAHLEGLVECSECGLLVILPNSHLHNEIKHSLNPKPIFFMDRRKEKEEDAND
jgi:hypothetical protein